MLNIIIFSLFSVVSPVQAGPAKCETLAPNLDGISITICAGEVVSRCDASGACLFSAASYASEVR